MKIQKRTIGRDYLMFVKQISVFLENKPGNLAQVTKILEENNIDISAVSIADTTEFGILRMIVDKPEKAESVIKSAKFPVATHRSFSCRSFR